MSCSSNSEHVQEMLMEAAIRKYLDDNFLSDFIYEHVEQIVIEEMQDLYFRETYEVPLIISEEVVNDMLRR